MPSVDLLLVAAIVIVLVLLVVLALRLLRSFSRSSKERGQSQARRDDEPSSSGTDSSEDQFRVQLGDLQERTDDLEERLKLVEAGIKQPGEQETSDRNASAPIPEQEVTKPKVVEAKEPLTSKQEVYDFRDMYNAVIEGKVDRGTFRELFRPVRVGIANAVERMRNSTTDPIFRTANDGDYLAVELVVQGNKRFAVVPRFDLTFQESSHGPGAMGKVFDCSGYDRERLYRHVKVRKPAFFEQTSGEEWELTHKGELELEQSE